jgi:hypothetical protein
MNDSTPAHRALATQKKMAYLGFKCFDHLPYPTDLAPSDYHLFPGLKNQFKGRRIYKVSSLVRIPRLMNPETPSLP